MIIEKLEENKFALISVKEMVYIELDLEGAWCVDWFERNEAEKIYVKTEIYKDLNAALNEIIPAIITKLTMSKIFQKTC